MGLINDDVVMQSTSSAGGKTAAVPGSRRWTSHRLRKFEPLDLKSVAFDSPETWERPRLGRAFGLKEAPTYRPTAKEFKYPFTYIAKISEEAKEYGICKVSRSSVSKPCYTKNAALDYTARRMEAIIGSKYRGEVLS